MNNPLRRHLRWIGPLVAAPVIYFAAASGSTTLARGGGSSFTLGPALLGLLLASVAFAGPITAIIFAIRGGMFVYGEWRRSQGRYTKRETTARDLQRQSADAWRYAGDLRRRLIARHVPDQIESWTVVPQPGEVFFFDVPADYARYYGQDVSYSQSSSFFFGRPAFVVAGLALSAAANAARRSAAAAQAAVQWREQQPTRVIVSNQRLICQVEGQWLSFAYSAMTAIYPEVESWTLVAQFGSTSPLMLRGQWIPSVAVITTLMTHGTRALEAHPSLQPLGEVGAGGAFGMP